MSDEKRRPRPAVQYGPTAATVASNLKRLRERRGLTIYSLSGALDRAGRAITPSAIAKIERQQRQVTVDDLTALAIVLGVSPSALLLPLTDQPADPVDVTGGGTATAVDVWQWANGRRPFKLTPGKEQTELLEHQLYGLPQWLRDYRAELHANVARDFPGRVETDPNTGLPVLVFRNEQEGGDSGPSMD
ncbi:helix-turn-helix domain-containing protein [Streptomyces europaeiscabiei]|uniref:helix-turn-helix domain-containing protein n=1 Tax=Streptomyces europaeiscabiei TaxID=146819 RepID=UPI0029AC135A|nr:helix-turn-helix transcriptional regulator [Streptomyces europaeiscabiei]MDX3841046.1 helix-turn-helix transcriptional regulator [Streptomyces europaeiscabiei]